MASRRRLRSGKWKTMHTNLPSLRFFFTTGKLKSPILQCLGESLSVAGSSDNLQTTAQNTRVTDELLASDCFKRLSGWANLLFWTFAPLLAAFVEAQMTILAESQPSLVWNFVGSVFAACTFNFGPHAITVPHLDFGNLSWGWCTITALGRLNPDLGGYLVLWDLKLII
ncbi:hypothetical protein DFH08DRAFT_1007601 [Mycena albidolilacea]|uniref:Uncharacterized protein n=1 Tax=Mycena albidolilacea TaxID=1033008 RepID=A0AAD7EQ99_9AGAR|nr:hypothetical protein DFH08DRAFT_1007601 [Mycena albidolilacea]